MPLLLSTSRKMRMKVRPVLTTSRQAEQGNPGKQRRHPDIAAHGLDPHGFLQGDRQADGGDHEALRGPQQRRAKHKTGEPPAQRRAAGDCPGKRQKGGHRIAVAAQHGGEAGIDRGEARIHRKIAEGEEHPARDALDDGERQRQRHIEAGELHGIEQLLEPVETHVCGFR